MKLKESGNMKTMKKLFAAAFMATAALVSCQEDQFAEQRNDENYYASVETFGTGTRTTLGEDRSVVWSSGDRIAIFEGSDKGNAYQVQNASVGSSSGEFSPVGNLSTEGTGAAIEGTVAVYPFSEDLSIEPDGDKGFIIKGVNFPAEQTYTAGSFSDGAFPMAAVCEQGRKNLSFKNIGGVLRLSLKGDYAVSSITVRGNSGEPVSGPATVTIGPDGIPSVTMAEDASRSVTLVCAPAVQLDAENAKEFHISIPVTDFETGFTVTVTDSEGNTYRKQTTLANPVMRSTIHIMPPTDLSEDISDEATENYIDLGIGRNAQITSYDAASGNLSLEYSSSTIPFIEPGKAFVMPVEQGGDIRVIDSHTTSGSTVTLQTSEGNMCNLFKNTSFTLSTSSEPDTRSAGEWNVITPSAYGYIDEDGVYHEVFNLMTKAGDPPKYTSDMELWSFHEDFNDEELISGSAGRLFWEKCEFDAGLKGDFRFDFGEKKISEIRSEGDIKHFKYEIKGSYNVDMLLKYEYGAEYEEEKDEFLNIRIPSGMFTFVVGTVPVHLRVDTRIGKATEFKVEGSVSASAGINLGSEISIGAEFTPENGLQPIQSIKNNNALHTPELEISASASAKVSYYPHIDIKFYNLIGPWFEARPYLSEDISAGMTLSADGSRNLGWKSLTSAGLDLHMGLSAKFLSLSLNYPAEPMNLFEAIIFEAPKEINRISPAQGSAVMKGQAVDATFKAESYSPLTKKYYPCPGALIYFDTKDGTYSPKVAIADINGMATTKWTPKPNTATKVVTEHNLTASIIDHEGEAIDETTLTVCFEEAEQWVDLGLSVLWAGWNVGADSPEEYGGYYAWGETTEKEKYTYGNYKHKERRDYSHDDHDGHNCWCWFPKSIGSDISGTKYDAARVKWGDGARIPRKTELEELVEKCVWTTGWYNGVEGHYVTGPNGNRIFIPFAGRKFNGYEQKEQHYDSYEGYFCCIWSSECGEETGDYAYSLSKADIGLWERQQGGPIRPVKNIQDTGDGNENFGAEEEPGPEEYGSMPTKGHWVDLGLSVKWAGWNVGADCPQQYGGYFAWGETEEKNSYDLFSYLYVNISFDSDDNMYTSFIDLGSDICGTRYDVAHVKWGDGARMPSRSEFEELLANCTFERGYHYGTAGYFVIGPNGNSIFIPFSGQYSEGIIEGRDESFSLWSGTLYDGLWGEECAYALHTINVDYARRDIGLNVRPVKD